MAKPIYLIGYMGSGKSTLGAKLAAKMGLKFIDLDVFIEEQQGRSITEIFHDDGEQAFRKIESEALKEVSRHADVVISVGGGTPCFNDNMTLIKRSGTSIYIKLPPKVLVDRLKHAKDERPIIQHKTDEELLKFISHQLEIRSEHYEQCEFQVNGIGITAEQVMRLL